MKDTFWSQGKNRYQEGNFNSWCFCYFKLKLCLGSYCCELKVKSWYSSLTIFYLLF